MKRFMIRKSALGDDWYYIDFDGEYEVAAISRITGITENLIHQIYEETKGTYDSERKVYYFAKRGLAVDATDRLKGKLKKSKMTKVIELTEEEVEYIRKALIKEDSNMIFTNKRIQTTLFNKLNE